MPLVEPVTIAAFFVKLCMVVSIVFRTELTRERSRDGRLQKASSGLLLHLLSPQQMRSLLSLRTALRGIQQLANPGTQGRHAAARAAETEEVDQVIPRVAVRQP
jgi:hypothetical protein